MRNLLIFITTLNPGGAERIVWELARRLSGFHVCVAALDGSGEYAARLREAGVEVYDLKCHGLLAAPKAVLKLRRLIIELEVDLLNTHLFHAGLVGRLAAAGTGVAVVGTCHIAERRWSQRWRFLADRLTYFLTKGEICVSEHVADFQAEQTGIRCDYFHVVPNGIDLDCFKPSADCEALRRECGIDSDALVIGFLGRFDYQKGADRYIEMVKALNVYEGQVVKLIAGYGDMQNELQQAAQGQVRFCGYYEQPQEFLQLLDVCVMPSRWEGFGLVAVEAMACGAVVVASDVDSLPKVLDFGTAGLLVSNGDSVEQWAAQLSALCADKQRLVQLRQSGLQNATRYSLEAMVGGYENVFNCLINV